MRQHSETPHAPPRQNHFPDGMDGSRPRFPRVGPFVLGQGCHVHRDACLAKRAGLEQICCFERCGLLHDRDGGNCAFCWWPGRSLWTEIHHVMRLGIPSGWDVPGGFDLGRISRVEVTGWIQSAGWDRFRRASAACRRHCYRNAIYNSKRVGHRARCFRLKWRAACPIAHFCHALFGRSVAKQLLVIGGERNHPAPCRMVFSQTIGKARREIIPRSGQRWKNQSQQYAEG